MLRERATFLTLFASSRGSRSSRRAHRYQGAVHDGLDGDGLVKVLVIPEDPTLDQYILKPLVSRLFSDLGRAVSIDVLSKPQLRGVAQALNVLVLFDIAETYRMIDLWRGLL